MGRERHATKELEMTEIHYLVRMPVEFRVGGKNLKEAKLLAEKMMKEYLDYIWLQPIIEEMEFTEEWREKEGKR
jgi:hypothetical protein